MMQDVNTPEDSAGLASDVPIKDIFNLTKEEVREMAHLRLATISKEFEKGFRFLEDHPKSVTFFGSNQFKEDNPYYISARMLASRIGDELNYSILSGGGPGIMEAANRGAKESGGRSLGLTIKLPREQIINNYITHQLDLYYFFVRKVCLSFSAEAFIFFPGGYGTLDEFFEILTLVQTRKVSGVPIVCVGSEYWNKVNDLIKTEMLARGAVEPEDLALYTITDDHDQIIDIIRNVPVRTGLPFNGGSTL
jgi:uncharacterized protein (TIGR00730 family)